jgi:hypothetical protein
MMIVVESCCCCLHKKKWFLRVIALLLLGASSSVVVGFSPRSFSFSKKLASHHHRHHHYHHHYRKKTPTTPSTATATTTTTTSTRRHMVFDLDESRVEKITTQDLIDLILDESLRTSARRPIMKQFDPDGKAIWQHWRGTVLSDTWKAALGKGIWAAFVYFLFQQQNTQLLTSNSKYPGIFFHNAFQGCNRVWTEILAITTFTLTFFVNEAYSCWRTCLNICYNVQGRLNDYGMALASAAKRVEPKQQQQQQQQNSSIDSMDVSSTYTPESRKVLLIVARYIRLFNILSYAAFTRSHRPLITPQGLRRMVSRGLLTTKERKFLISSQVSATSRHNQILMWAFRISLDAIKAGHLEGGYGLEQNLYQRIQEIRSQGNYMECVLRGRLPFAYVHIVQVLVDAVLWAYPIMAFSASGGSSSFVMGVGGTMLLTITYQGLFDLAKRFLDPFHNENFWMGDDPIMVSTLIAETNAGSLRWLYCLEDMPLPMSIIKSGGAMLDEFVLPDEGFTVEEAAAREEEKKAPPEEPIVSYEEEFEEAKAILNTPPGYEFVPGIDDTTIFTTNNGTSTDTEFTTMEQQQVILDEENYIMEPSMELYEQFVETAAEEFEARESQEPAVNGEMELNNGEVEP